MPGEDEGPRRKVTWCMHNADHHRRRQLRNTSERRARQEKRPAARASSADQRARRRRKGGRSGWDYAGDALWVGADGVALLLKMTGKVLLQPFLWLWELLSNGPS